MVEEAGFDSPGTRCGAWYVRAGSDALTGERGRPCVVMGHGFGRHRDAGVAEAHRHGMLTIAHTLTVDATRMAVQAGIDGLAHLFMDAPHTDAGVDIITGSDASVPVPSLGGVAHGASVHHELQYLVRAGLAPVEALRTATATPARRVGLTDRGRIAEAVRADLLLVGGDPTTTIEDTLNLRSVWRRGSLLSLR